MAGNGGIIGPTNTTSFGKNKITVNTSNTPSAVTTQPGTKFIDYTVVAGAGSGGNNVGGGGGAGGLVYRQCVPVSGATALGAVVIGGGATAPVSPGNNQGTNGSDSTFVIECVTVTAKGGGGGGGLGGPGNDPGPVEVAQPGGSGGGASSYYPPAACTPQTGGSTTQGPQPGISGSSGFGNAGGNSNSACALYSGGGGGSNAAGSIGNKCSPAGSGPGGSGKDLSSSFSTGVGVCGVLAGGGGGGHYSSSCVGTGGAGGGGAGGSNNDVNFPGIAGIANSGGGGGGVAGTTSPTSTRAGNGGSGVVIVKEAGQGGFVASGVWSLTEQLKAKKEGNWQ